ncbi:hypothetical protein Cni_G24946 [Canna indica]|uniref:SAM domain-containing protein n=1 Tax=Canna indica TaxID=4628 RepID=A0AAQ3KWP5_9LILI|nr:hypothetical protein Cni_G24946 [Canna indica]
MEDLHPPEPPSNGGATASLEPPAPPLLGTKRQRRPSVRLGEIGDQPAAIPSDPHVRRPKHWRLPSSVPGDHTKPRPYHQATAHRQPSKTRHLTTLAPGGDEGADILPPAPPLPLSDDGVLLPVDENLDPLGAGVRRVSRDPKPWRGARRVRSSWVLKADEGMEGADFKPSGVEDAADDGFPEESGSPSERNDRRAGARVRVSESRDAGPAVEGDLPSETDGGDWNDRNGLWRSREDGGVRSWLDGLGLGRYAPVFEIHEVDDEVLPLLTLEDLKDMGINAVGSRRKMFCAIQRLRKNTD